MTADNPQSVTTDITRIRSTHRTTARRFVLANKMNYKLTKLMITPTVRCHSLPEAKYRTVALSASLGRKRVVCIASCYRLDGLGIDLRWGLGFQLPSRPEWGPHSLLYNGYRVFLGGKVAEACIDRTLLSRDEVKVKSYFSTPPLGFRGLF
jgi:hypothetical protein